MKLMYLIAILFMSILVLGCSAKETQQSNVTVTQPTTTQPSVPTTQTNVTVTHPAAAAGTVLIADTENQRVIEINKDTKEITWQYGCSKVYSSGRCDAGSRADQLKQPASAFYDGANILIADKGNNRIIEVSKNKDTVWNYSIGLNQPTFAIKMKNGDFLITDSITNKVMEVNSEGALVWQYGCARLTNTQKCAPGTGTSELNVPNAAVELSNGNILISDKGNNRIIEVTKAKEIAFEYKSGLNFPAAAQAYDSGYAIVNTNANRLVFIDAQKAATNEFSFLSHPTYVSIEKTNLLITDSFNNRILETDKEGNIVWYYGDCSETDGQPAAPCTLGAGIGQLFKPSTAVLG
jgi:hypothetical protein